MWRMGDGNEGLSERKGGQVNMPASTKEILLELTSTLL